MKYQSQYMTRDVTSTQFSTQPSVSSPTLLKLHTLNQIFQSTHQTYDTYSQIIQAPKFRIQVIPCLSGRCIQNYIGIYMWVWKKNDAPEALNFT